ncbi:hypothetical protein D9M68_524770 [compost metagenome]
MAVDQAVGAEPGGFGDGGRGVGGGQAQPHDGPEAARLAGLDFAQALVVQPLRELHTLHRGFEQAGVHGPAHGAAFDDGTGQLHVARRAALHGVQRQRRDKDQQQGAQARAHEAGSWAPSRATGSSTRPRMAGLNQPGAPYRLSMGL